MGENSLHRRSRCQRPTPPTRGNTASTRFIDGRRPRRRNFDSVQRQSDRRAAAVGTLRGCRPNPLAVDPCAGLDDAACDADSRCITRQHRVQLPPRPTLVRPVADATPSSCRLKTASTTRPTADCAQHPACSPTPPSSVAGRLLSGHPCRLRGDAGVRPERRRAVRGLLREGRRLLRRNERGHLRLTHSECHPVGSACYCPSLTDNCECGGGSFHFCEPDDGLQRCNESSDCGGGQRCSNDEILRAAHRQRQLRTDQLRQQRHPSARHLPSTRQRLARCAGLRRPVRSAGLHRLRRDPVRRRSQLRAALLLNCSPYGGGGGFDGDSVAPGCAGPQLGTNGAVNSCNPCEPNFTQCVTRQPGSEIDPEVSVLEPTPRSWIRRPSPSAT